MKRMTAAVAVLLVAGLWASEAAAWRGANRFGGSTQHSWGETSHDNRWGGSSEHVAGQGTEHTNAWGGNTAHAFGGGTEHTNVYGGQTYGAAGAGVAHTYPGGATAYRPPGYYPGYPAYHPPAVVPVYSTGCYGCAAAAGAIVGVAAGAAVASANTAATTSAYNAGVAAGAAASVPPPAIYAMGTNYATLPAGCMMPKVGGATYYLCGNTWFKPLYGANGVYYRVVPTP